MHYHHLHGTQVESTLVTADTINKEGLNSQTVIPKKIARRSNDGLRILMSYWPHHESYVLSLPKRQICTAILTNLKTPIKWIDRTFRFLLHILCY